MTRSGSGGIAGLTTSQRYTCSKCGKEVTFTTSSGLVGWILVSGLAAFIGWRHHQGQLDEIRVAEAQGIPHSTAVANWDLLLCVPAALVSIYVLFELSKYVMYPAARAEE